jgi:hypothetical protein
MTDAITLPPLGRVVTPARVVAWLAAAEPGARLVYAQGVSEPRHAPVWGLARSLCAAGDVLLFAEVVPDDASGRVWRWMMHKPSPFASVRAAAGHDVLTHLSGDALNLLWWLREHVGADGVCALPSLEQLGLALGLRAHSAKDRARYLLRQFEGSGRIRIETLPGGGRVAILTELGTDA